MKPYQRSVVRLIGWLLAQVGTRAQIQSLQLYEPFNIGIFVAMCLASYRAPLKTRLTAIAVGIPTLACFGVVLVLAVIALYGALRVHPGPIQAAVLHLASSSLETIPWISAPVMWALLLGSWELPLRGSQSGKSARRA